MQSRGHKIEIVSLVLQVFHYTGLKKSCGLTEIDPVMDTGWGSNESGSDSEEDDNCDNGHVVSDDSGYKDMNKDDHNLTRPIREGKFFNGTVTRFDSRSQAFYIEFDDGDEGWFQLWRDRELFELLT